MYICFCNALTDADIRRATDSHGARRPAEVFECCGCRAQCGACVRTLCGMVRDALHGSDPAEFASA
ncbi:MAG TPA: (2Fe-2S)-binding protein [Rhodopila sp.]|uniref:(2Fe-2S)-binding protein n=1 Tax=Rhodopila sp. TaxID=2480087 RepID=UPI002D102CCD|nr:(2Fe-2S)-binding protein [Rhodopila sp.]HVY13759.1 (2Fe-2S)-binding protein [Rhodopila sp.]